MALWGLLGVFMWCSPVGSHMGQQTRTTRGLVLSQKTLPRMKICAIIPQKMVKSWDINLRFHKKWVVGVFLKSK